ncbi:hypothetical protein LINGRAHAP2_LOCUS4967, partial [Linum grandiflorum]
MGEVWARNRRLNFDKYYSASKSLDENLTNVPPGFSEAQWGAFVKMRTEDDKKVKVAQNQVNKKMQKRNHAGGSRHYSRYFEELEKETGKVPSRGEVWRRANKRVDGSWEDAAAEAMANRIQYYEDQGVPREEGYGDSYSLARRDLEPEYKGEHSGRVVVKGRSVTPSQLNCDPTSRVSGATSSRAQSVESRPDLESLIRSMQEEWQQRQQEWLQMSAAREADWQQREAAREAEWKQRYEQLENKVA